MSYYYLNTNPFVKWAETKAGSSDHRVRKIGEFTERLMSNPAAVRVVSEITIAEVLSRICILWRSPDKSCDQAWAQGVQDQLMTWISDGRIEVLPLPSKVIEKAVLYVITATREHARNLRSWDAAHLYHAAEWSKRIGQKVNMVTNDSDFQKILEVYPEFAAYVEIVDPAAG